MLHDGLIHSTPPIVSQASPSSIPRHGHTAVKYFERRRKNNLAAKKSRDARRVRENQLKVTITIRWKGILNTIIVTTSSSQIKVLCLENANRLLRTQLAREKEVVAELSEAVQRLSDKLEEMRQRESGGGGGGSGNSRLMRN